MNLRSYLDVIRARKLLIMSITVLTLLAASLLCLTRPITYQASATVYISTGSAGSVNDLSTGNSFAQQAATNYAQVATQPYVINAVARQLKLSTLAELQGSVSTSVPVGTSLINITSTSSDALRSAQIANAVSSQLADAIVDLTPYTKSLSSVKVTRTASATVPVAPIAPKPALYIAVGLIGGAFLGVLLALFRDVLDVRIRTPEDAVAASGLPLIGTVSDYGRRGEVDVFTQEADSSGAVAVAQNEYRALRTNLDFVSLDGPIESILISSALPGEGKTTTAINLMFAIAAQGKRVLLIDADLRRPQVADYLGMDGSLGLSDVLARNIALASSIQQVRSESAFILPSGSASPNPTEMIQSVALTSLLQACVKEYDLVIVDSAPVLAVPDAMSLAAQVSGVIVVSAMQVGRRPALRAAVSQLQSTQARIFGVNVNRVRAHGLAHYYGIYNESEY